MDVGQIITARVMEMLEKGVVPWRKPWVGGLAGQPKNLLSQKEYRGINTMLLSCAGYKSPYWLTYKQAKEIGGYVKAGEKGMPIIKALFVDGENKSNDKTDSDGSKTDTVFKGMRVYTVFNASQCELPAKLRTMLNDKEDAVREVDPIPAAEKIAADMPNKPRIGHLEATQRYQAYYSPSQDMVQIPALNAFTKREEYYSTLFHELGHSTKHPSRLNRRESFGKSGTFGDTNYSKEELIAEMTATFCCGLAGIVDETIENSAAYIGSWLSHLENDKSLVLMAAREAQRAVDYILGKEVKPHASKNTLPGEVTDDRPVNEPPAVVVRKSPTPPHKQPITERDPLQAFVAKRGGIDPDYNQGQWRYEVNLLLEQGKGVLPGLLNKRAGLTVEEMTEACAEAGYLSSPDPDELFYHLAKDVEACGRGSKEDRVYSQHATIAVDFAWEKYNERQEQEETLNAE